MKLLGTIGIAASVLVLFASCHRIVDFVHMDPLEVVSWAPVSDFVETTPVVAVEVTFSQEMDRVSAESAFSLSAADTALSGRYRWTTSKTVIFTPDQPIAAPGTYTMEIGIGAEDRYGNSLSEPFLHRFTVGSDRVGPSVAEVTPAQGEAVNEPRPAIAVVFDEPMDESSLWGAFSLSPDSSGSFALSDDGTTLSYTLLENLQSDTRYTIDLSTAALDTSGNPLADAFVSTFRTISDEALTVVSVTNVDTGALLQDSEQRYINNDAGLTFEKLPSFSVTFSRPLTPSELDGALQINGTSTETSWNAAYDAAILRPTEPLTWQEIYELQVIDATFRFRVDGVGSEPPAVVRTTYTADVTAGTPTFYELRSGDVLPFDTTVNGAFDVYIDRSPVTEIDLASFAEAFAVDATNGAVSFDFVRIERSPTAPVPDPAPEADQTVFRVYANVSDDAVSLGVISVTVDNTLTDTNGNGLAEAYSISLNES